MRNGDQGSPARGLVAAILLSSAFWLATCAAASAQLSVVPKPPDLTLIQAQIDAAKAKAETAAAQAAAVQAAMPTPATSAPPIDVMGGAIGTTTSIYALANHQHPRITNSPKVLTVAGGTFSGTFPTGLFASAPTISLTWMTTGSVGAVSCEMRTVSTVAYAGRCTTLLGLVPAPAGIEVNVLALPAS